MRGQSTQFNAIGESIFESEENTDTESEYSEN